MMGLSLAIELAKRAMMAQQGNINVLGQNIANVNTPGYTRQRAILTASLPLNVAPGALGTGVEMKDVLRNRDNFADRQYRREKGVFGQMDSRAGVLSQIEGIVGEPSDTGVRTLLERFFSSWSDLSNNPGDRNAKVSVQTAGRELAGGIHRLHERLGEYRTSLNDEVNLKVGEANDLLAQVADLNAKITVLTNTNKSPNDLMDRRDLLIDQLAELTGATVIPQADGTVSVRLGGKSLVDGSRAERLEIQQRGLNDPLNAPILYANGDRADISAGRIGGLLQMRDATIQQLRSDLDTLANGLITEVNKLHSQGQNGLDFFTGTDAASFKLSAGVENDAAAINAGRSSYPGDNDLALALAGLKGQSVLRNGTTSFNGFFAGLVGSIGSETRAAEEGAKHQLLAVSQVEAQREAAGGVNMDEELANLTQAQQAYQAAARYMSTVSGMLDTLITELGR